MSDRPYADNVDAYLAAGWPAVIPTGNKGQRNAKKPVPSGVTGEFGTIPTAEQIAGWKKTHAINNIALVMPEDGIGIDVDQYLKDGVQKNGMLQLTAIEDMLGSKLPPSPISSSRGVDNPSGIRFFRIPRSHIGRKFKSTLAADIEVIRPVHRYAIVSGSYHDKIPENAYEWYDRTHSRVTGIPKYDSLIDLSDYPEWLEFLLDDGVTVTQRLDGKTIAEMDDGAAAEWIVAHGAGQPCRAVRGVVKLYAAQLGDDTEREASHYDTAVAGVWALLQLATEGHRGARIGVKELRDVYEGYASGVAHRDLTEWARLVVKGIEKAAALTDDDFWEQHADGACPDRAGSDNTWPSPNDPMPVARRFVVEHYTHMIGTISVPTLRRWRGDFYRWTGAHWIEHTEAALKAELYAALESAQYFGAAEVPTLLGWKPSPGKIRGVLDALAAVIYTADEFTPDHDGKVSLADAVLDLETRKTTEHTPERFNLVSLPYNYDEAATCHRWQAFLATLWPDDPESVELLQEWVGYLVSGSTHMQKIGLMVGPPRSGKGTIARMISQLIGPHNVAGPTLAQLGTNFGLQPIIGKSVAIIGDARFGSANSQAVVERLLSISGEDVQTIDRKNKEPWTGQVGARFLIISNELPNLVEASGALASRFVGPLVLKRSWLGNEDLDLGESLAPELGGILTWALDGLDRLVANRRFTVPTASEESRRDLEETGSPVIAFMRERCKRSKTSSTSMADLYENFDDWSRANGQRLVMTLPVFGKNLRAAYPDLEFVRSVLGGRRETRIEGVVLREPEHP